MTKSAPFFNHFDTETKHESPNLNTTSLTDHADGFFESMWNGVSGMWDYLTNSTPTESINATNNSVNGTSPTTLAPENHSVEEEETAKKSKKASKKATEAPEEDDDYDERTTKKSVKSKKATVDDDEDEENDEE